MRSIGNIPHQVATGETRLQGAFPNNFIGQSSEPDPLGTPTLTGTAGDTQVTWSWTAVDGATSYEIELDGASAVDIGNVLEYLDDELTNGVEREARVRAVDSNGPGGWSDLVARTPAEPSALPSPNLVFDGFESGDMTAPNGPSPALNASGFSWGNLNRTSIVTKSSGTSTVIWNGSTVNIEVTDGRDWTAKEGDNCLRFRYPADEPMSEQRFDLGTQATNFWLRYWIRVPTNFVQGSLNSKFLSLWPQTYDTRGTLTLQTRPSSGNARLVYQDGGVTAGEVGAGGGTFIRVPEDRGRWMQMVVNYQSASGADALDGVIGIWRRWEDESAFTELVNNTSADTWEDDASAQGIGAGFFMSWANDPYDEDTEWLLDSVEMSTSTLLPS